MEQPLTKYTAEAYFDEDNCDTCGYDYAIGYQVFNQEGDLLKDFVPRAHCMGGDSYEPSDVYKYILSLHGIEVLID